MLEFNYQIGSRRRKHFRTQGDSCAIGSARDCDLIIDSRAIAKRHAELSLDKGVLTITDSGSSTGTWVNRVRTRQSGPLSAHDEIVVGDVAIHIIRTIGSTSAGGELEVGFDSMNNSTELTQSRTSVLSQSDQIVSRDSAHFSPQTASIKHEVEQPGVMTISSAMPGPTSLQSSISTTSPNTGATAALSAVSVDEELSYWGRIVHEQLISQMDLRRKDVHRMSDQQLREEALDLIGIVVVQLRSQMPAEIDTKTLTVNVLNEAIGLGPLEKFLNDDSISEIMVNNHREIFVEKAGRLERSTLSFSSDAAVYAVIERIITPLGRRVDEGSPIVDARLKDGSRVNAVIPPLALKGPSLTIRKFSSKRLQFSDLVEHNSLSESMVKFLRICVERHKNIIVSGGTGSGKTTLLNVLSNFIPHTDRVVTIEDAAELKLVQPNLVSLESRPPNLEGRGEISIRDLLKNALRMRPDRIVIGECRGGEAIDMLQAMNTGHDGSLTTIHANNPRDVISRLEVLVLMAGMELPVTAIREQVAAAVDIIIQQSRFPCGSRKITKVTEVVGVEGNTVQLQDIFEYRQSGVSSEGYVQGSFVPTGFMPSFYEQLRQLGVNLDLDLFNHTHTTTDSNTGATPTSHVMGKGRDEGVQGV